MRTLTLEDAPRGMRVGFIKGVLNSFVGTQRRYSPRAEPLDTQETHEAFIALIRDESDPWDYDQDNSWTALSDHLKSCAWTEFYDFVELLGALLQKKDDDVPFNESDYFKSYRTKVNSLFEEDAIGWNLNEKSELHRQVPRPLANRLNSTDSALTDKYVTARVHYQKAIAYLYQHPIDEANSIKEIVSAIESVAKSIVPKATTLGEAVKLLRKDARFSDHLLSALEKLYAYSNVTPLIRHGHVAAERPILAEAELSLFMGVAYIRYLIEMSGGSSKPSVARR